MDINIENMKANSNDREYVLKTNRKCETFLWAV